MVDRHSTSYPPPSSAEILETRVIKGIAGAPGVSVGTALVIGSMRASYTRRNIHTAQMDDELRRIGEGVERAKESLRQVAARLPAETGRAQVSILDAYLAMLDDPLLHDRIAKKIRIEKKGAEWAVASAAEDILAMFDSGAKDAYIAERRHDVEFVCDQLLRAIRGETGGMIPKLEHPTIVIARDLSPADTDRKSVV